MVAWSTGIEGSTAMTSHSDGPDGSDMAEFLQLQGVEPRDDAGCFDGPGDGGADVGGGRRHRPLVAAECREVAFRQLLIEHYGHSLVVHRIMPCLDPVRRERPATQRRAPRAAIAEPGREFGVADRVAGQIRADAGDICLIHEVHSATGRTEAHRRGYLSWAGFWRMRY